MTVVKEHGARSGLVGFIETVHTMMSVLANECGVPGMELTVGLHRRHHGPDPRAQ
ncbi:hypothetical protein ACFQ6B_35740 [Streptomyces wedmorensis]|uniref:Uncharacterized protein n=1 Tax=Streptomyces wedmorensis TaxID=43759 RepID=A0ABW6J452_STRWE